MHDLKNFFEPRSVALIGASRKKGKVGNALMKNLLLSKVKAFPVNLKDGEVLGIRAHKSLLEIKDKIDLAVIAVPAQSIPKVIDDCGAKRVKNVIVISAGFGETGNTSLEKEVLKKVKSYGMRMIGPNCLGVINPWKNFNSTFFNGMTKKGGISFISQSGALGVAVLDKFLKEGSGFSKFVSIGNMTETSVSDIISYLDKDDKTKVIAVYMESLKNGKKFIETCKKARKPVLILKAGKSLAGANAAKSHTGALAGSHKIYSGAFKQCGAKECNSLTQLFNASKVIESYGLIKDKRVVVLTNAGGAGVLMTDACSISGMQVVELPKKVIEQLDKFLPGSWSHGNPIDVLGDASAQSFERVLKTLAKQIFYDALIVLFTPQAMSQPALTAQKIIENKKNLGAVVACFLGGKKVEKAKELLKNAGIPVFDMIKNVPESFFK
ncbi:MAG: CoA-binding protein [Nanoarchaeota archaeon]|nr:CoA-binding protein [Nanoarchaeota archaeon]